MNYTIFGQGRRQSVQSEMFHVVEECFSCTPNGTAWCKDSNSNSGNGSNGTNNGGPGNGGIPNGMLTVGNRRSPEILGSIYFQPMVVILLCSMAINL